jgi:hypothetical protein
VNCLKTFFVSLILSGACIALAPYDSIAQDNGDFSWWNEANNWDGVRHWSDYIPVSPGRMGPNALPVPEMQKGRIDTLISVLAAGEVHLAPNDFTADVFTKTNIPIKKVIAIQVVWVPFEYFNTDSIVRDSRSARTRKGEGTASGDVYISTLIPLVSQKKNWPDILLGINLRTASGGQFQNARFTDSPGYFFDLSAVKDFLSPDGKNLWKLYATGGFYVYQTNTDTNRQNDAILWGAGLDWVRGKLGISLTANGYIGYLDDLDTPAVLRFETSYQLNSKLGLILRLQEGNRSYPFTSIRAGLRASW